MAVPDHFYSLFEFYSLAKKEDILIIIIGFVSINSGNDEYLLVGNKLLIGKLMYQGHVTLDIYNREAAGQQ